jgi:hypothetical protein
MLKKFSLWHRGSILKNDYWLLYRDTIAKTNTYKNITNLWLLENVNIKGELQQKTEGRKSHDTVSLMIPFLYVQNLQDFRSLFNSSFRSIEKKQIVIDNLKG